MTGRRSTFVLERTHVARYRTRKGKRTVVNYTTVDSHTASRHEKLRKFILSLCEGEVASLVDLYVLDMRNKGPKYVPVVAPAGALPEGPDSNTKYIIRSFLHLRKREEVSIESTAPDTNVEEKPAFYMFRVVRSTSIKR